MNYTEVYHKCGYRFYINSWWGGFAYYCITILDPYTKKEVNTCPQCGEGGLTRADLRRAKEIPPPPSDPWKKVREMLKEVQESGIDT